MIFEASLLLLFAANVDPFDLTRVPDYSYLNMNGGPNVGFYAGSPRMRLGDQIDRLNDCSSDSVICAERDGILIAQPIKNEGRTSDGTLVKATRTIEGRVFGFDTKATIVDAKRGPVDYRYWYSEDKGLLAFTVTLKGRTVVYLLQQTEGLKPIRENR